MFIRSFILEDIREKIDCTFLEDSIKYSNWIELYRGMVEGGKNINWYLMLHILAPLLHACVLAYRMQICFIKNIHS